MDKRKFWRNLTRIHKWAGLILAIQITLWFASGVVMSFFHIDKVRGRHLAEKSLPVIIKTDIIHTANALDIYRAKYDIEANMLTLKSAAGNPVYQINGTAGELYINAKDGSPWAGIDKAQARRAAKSYYKGNGSLRKISLMQTTPKEYKGDLPVWRADFDDQQNTRLYINAITGELSSVRTRLWRFFDFMWMLHIMDYDERDDFNNWLLRIFSAAALLFAFSGIGLLIHRIALRPRPRPGPKNNK